MKNNIFKHPFSDNIKILWKHINRNEISEISEQYDRFLQSKETSAEDSRLSKIIKFFIAFIEEKEKSLDNLEILFKEFDNEYSKSDSDAAKNAILVEFVSALGKTSAKKRKQDKKALRRFFDKDAATERYQKHVMSQKKIYFSFFPLSAGRPY